MPIVAALGAALALIDVATKGIALVQRLQAEDRPATEEEMAQLAALSDLKYRLVRDA